MTTIRSLQSLEGRAALVTGAAGRVGRATCETLGELGAFVIGTDSDAAGLTACIDNLSDLGYPASALPADLEDESAISALPSRVVDETGRLDVLVNCAALVGTTALAGWSVPFREQSAVAWRRALETNLTAVFLLAQASAEVLAASGRGIVVNIASIHAWLGPDLRLYEGTDMGHPAAYAASKGGLVQLTRWLATVLAPRIRVNSISPGGIYDAQDPSFVARYEARTPLGRMANVDDLRGAIAYLTSDLSAYVTGTDLRVDGGWSAW